MMSVKGKPKEAFYSGRQLKGGGGQNAGGKGLGQIIREEGFHPVGSYVMKTMTWRDLDFERYDESPGLAGALGAGDETGETKMGLETGRH